MRKSNVVMVAIVVVASIVFLWLWFFLGFDRVDNPLDLVLSIIWWVMVVVLCLLVHHVEERRRRAIRTIYLAPGFIYNTERGFADLGTDGLYVPLMQEALDGLEYGFGKKETSELGERFPDFELVVHTDRYAEGGGTWKGEVVETYNPDNRHGFESIDELGAILDRR